MCLLLSNVHWMRNYSSEQYHPPCVKHPKCRVLSLKKGRPRKGSKYGMIESPRRYITVKWLILSGRRLVSQVTPVVIHTKEACKALRREVRFTLFQQRQDLLGPVMNACEQDTKLFHRLVRKQRARPNTGTETLKYDGNALSGAEEIAAGFSLHFRDLATPAPDASFDGEYFRQVKYDALVIEDLCNRQSISSFKPVTANEISSIIRSFRNGKAQDINSLSAEHLKYAAGPVALPLANLMNFFCQLDIFHPCCWRGC